MVIKILDIYLGQVNLYRKRVAGVAHATHATEEVSVNGIVFSFRAFLERNTLNFTTPRRECTRKKQITQKKNTLKNVTAKWVK